MSPNQRPAMMPFDPESDVVPAALDEWWTRADMSGTAFVLAVGGQAQRDGWAARATVALATAWADRGDQVILADLGLSAPNLHLELGEASTDGIADIFQFGASIRTMTRAIPGRGFRFLPAGDYLPDPAAILGDSRWEHLVESFRKDGSTLLLYLPLDTPGADQLVNRIGRVICLADPLEVAELIDRYTASSTVELLLNPPPAILVDLEAAEAEETEDLAALAADVPPVAAEPESRKARPLFEEHSLTEPPLLPREGRRNRRKVSLFLRTLLLATVFFGGWTVLESRDILPDWAAKPEWLRLDRWILGTATAPGTEADSQIAEVVEVPQVIGEPIETPLPFSVAVEAHQDYATALERVVALGRAEPRVTFYLTPIPNQGVVYYRLLAGPVADTAAAWALMNRLVEARQKTDLDPWSIRPTVWAYHLGDYKTVAAALDYAKELLESRIPTYLVEVEYTAGPPQYRLYAGAYEGPGPAETMAQLLRDTGIDAPLVRRQGKPIS